MESLERFQQNRRLIEDFTFRTLAAIPSDYGRLHYLYSLRDPATGRYEHDGLIRLYSVESVQNGLAHCHEELFARILETPLSEQEHDLRTFLRGTEGTFRPAVEAWRADGSLRAMCPEGLPNYLSDLFSSNLGVLLAIFSGDIATTGPVS